MSATIFPSQLVFDVRLILSILSIYLCKDFLLSLIMGSRQGTKKEGNRLAAKKYVRMMMYLLLLILCFTFPAKDQSLSGFQI